MTKRKKVVDITTEQQFQAYLNAVQEGISILDKDLTIVRANKILEDRIAKGTSLSGEKCYSALHGRKEPCDNCPSIKAMRDGKTHRQDVEVIKPNNKRYWAEVFSYPIKDENGNITGAIEYSRDITLRKRSEEELKEREQLYRTTLYSIGDAVITSDFSGRIVSMNPIAEQLTGWSESEAKQRPVPEIFRIINEKTRETADNPVEKVLKEGKIVGLANHTVLISRNGCEYPIADSGAPIKNDDGVITGVVLVFRDMSEELKMSKELEDSEKKYRMLVEQSTEMLNVNDLDGNILEVNKKALEITGYSKDELLGTSVFEFLVNDLDQVQVKKKWQEWPPYGESHVLEAIHKKKDGSAFPIEFSARKIIYNNQEAILALARDISERKKIEYLLEESRDWYRALAEDIPALITRISPAGIVTYVNSASAEIIGLPIDQIIGSDFYSLVPDDYRDKVKKSFDSLTIEQPIVVYEHYNKSRLFRWKNRAIFKESGELKEFFTIGEEITEQRKAEEELQESNKRNRALVEALPDLIFRYDRQGNYIDAEIKDVNRLTEKARQLYRDNRLIGLNIKEVLSPELFNMVRENIEKVLETGELHVLEYNYLVDGKPRHHEARMVKSGKDEVTSIVRDITDRKNTEEALRYQLHFEKTVAEISSIFVNMPADRLGEAIDRVLERAGQFFMADRSYVFRFSDDRQYMSVLYEWCAEGISSQLERNRLLPVDNTPWWIDQLLQKEFVHIPDVDQLPVEADKDKLDFKIEEIKSLLSLPLIKEGQIIGFFGFDAVKEKKSWSDQQISLVKVVAEIIAGALNRYEVEEALKESEERYREILATIEEGYYEADLNGIVTYCNDAACRLFGDYSKEEIIGYSYHKFYNNPGKAYEKFHNVFLTGKAERGLILEMIRKDGSIGFGELSISLIRNKEGKVTGFKGIGKDVTDRIEYEKRLEYLSLHDQLTGIYNRAYFETELNRLDNSRDYPITIISADLDGLKLINDTMGHDAGDRLLVKCAELLLESLRQSDIVSRVGGDEFSAILPHTGKDIGENIVKRIRENINNYNLVNEDLPLGVSLGVATLDKGGDGSLKALFKRADDMMYRDKLYRSSSSRGKIVQSLLAALAERDYITEGHARRLEDLCRAVGEKMNLSSHQLADLALLAQVHDLGKVGIPDHILFKPGPLTEDEWEIMRSHPEKGYRIASSSPDLSGIAEFILKHHERWDGSGYPLGLKETEIPVECRILAIVDAYDAMTNKRPYNVARSALEAKEELKEFAGIQFDPDIVNVFLSVLEKENE